MKINQIFYYTYFFSYFSAPGKPSIIPEDCSAENNSVTIAWQPHIGNAVESYSLELDDGNGGQFRVFTFSYKHLRMFIWHKN